MFRAQVYNFLFCDQPLFQIAWWKKFRRNIIADNEDDENAVIAVFVLAIIVVVAELVALTFLVQLLVFSSWVWALIAAVIVLFIAYFIFGKYIYFRERDKDVSL